MRRERNTSPIGRASFLALLMCAVLIGAALDSVPDPPAARGAAISSHGAQFAQQQGNIVAAPVGVSSPPQGRAVLSFPIVPQCSDGAIRHLHQAADSSPPALPA